MRLWTIQPYSVYQQLRRNGYFFCNPQQSENLQSSDFVTAYDWMIVKMKAKIGQPPEGVTTPLWGWYRINYENRHPDFRHQRDYDDEVCLELDIPANQVLLSDFESWHFVLNDWYKSPATDDQTWTQLDHWFDALPPSQQQQIKRQSWQSIFDITPRTGDWTKNGDTVQACFWSINANQVQKIWRLRKGQRMQILT
ncbi:DUF3841 domain-containing protein [Lactiplantibacillus plajomi]|uniref:DUF3841 domain-containing protein n=1 Tax=Lactiplantibacillus plajomi TaxID=1457217 RepID=A0ABV6K1A9_9LACO|nr:DUF3841 domain-containing protein [Lactiplantibacillus plajomi]